MKTRILVFTNVFCALSAHLFTASANIGDMAVYNNAGDVPISITEEGGTTPTIINRYTNTVVNAATEYTLEPNGDGIKLKSGGKHLVMYNVRIDNNNAVKYRAEMLTHLSLQTGSTTNELAYGRAQCFVRNEEGNNEGVCSSGTIIDATAGDILRLHSTRSDTRNDLDVSITPNHTAIQILKLDDSLDYIRLSRNTDSANTSPNSFTAVNFNSIDEASSGGNMSFTSGQGDITLNSAGYYLVFANIHAKKVLTNTTRVQMTTALSLDDTLVEGTPTATYMRGNQNGENCDDGTTVIGAVIKATAGQQLSVDQKETTETTQNYKIKANKTAIVVVKLPDAMELIRLQDTTGNNDFNQGASGTDESQNNPQPMAFGIQLETPSSNFSHNTSSESSKVNINTTSRYLFLSAFIDYDDGGSRVCPYAQWSLNDSILPYGETTEYSRNAYKADDNGSWLGMLSNLSSNDYVELVSRRLGNAGIVSGDSMGLQGLDLATITTEPVLILSGPMAITTNSTATVKTRHLLTRDSDTAESSLVYTLTSAPANALIYNDGTLLTNNATFSQSDISSGKITLTAEGTIGSFDVFDFSVSDGGSFPSTGTFSILASAGVATGADTGTTSEDTVLTLLTDDINSLLTNDFGVGLFVSAHDTVSTLGASVTVNSDGAFSYDPTVAMILQKLNNGATTNDTFTYTAEDFAGLSGSATVTITVMGTNDTFAATSDYVNNPALTETNALSITANLVANDGITATLNGSDTETLLLNYTAEYIGEPGRWATTGYGDKFGDDWLMDNGCTPVDVTSSYAGITRAYSYAGELFAKGNYDDEMARYSINDFYGAAVDEESASFELWIRPDVAALNQTNCLFETGGGTGMGIVLEMGTLKCAVAILQSMMTYDLLTDPLNVLDDDITNEFCQIVMLIDMDNDLNSLYVNGTLVDTAVCTITDWDGGDGSGLGHYGEANLGGFKSGAGGTPYDTYYKGDIAVFRIYDDLLTDAQVKQNYLALKTGNGDMDGALTVSGIYKTDGSLQGGTGTAVTLESGATVTLDTTTGSFTYDPTGIAEIGKMWDGAVYVDHFTYQASDGIGATADAIVEVVVHGVSQKQIATLAATEGRTTEFSASEILKGDQVTANGLNPIVALYANPELITQSDDDFRRWLNSGSEAPKYNAYLDGIMLQPVQSGFGGIGYATMGNVGYMTSLNAFYERNCTIELWFKPESTQSGKSIIFEAGGTTYGMMIYYDADRNSVTATIDGGDNNNDNENISAEIEGVNLNEFNQIVALIDIDNAAEPDVITLYLNSDPTTAFNAANSATVTNASGDIVVLCGDDMAGIGRKEAGLAFNLNYAAFEGQIAHLLVYDYLLNQSQLTTAYEAIRKPVTAVQGTPTTLSASTTLSAGTVTYDGTTIAPAIGYGNTGVDSFSYQYTDSDGSTVNTTAPVSVAGLGSSQAVDDSIVVSSNAGVTNINLLGNDTLPGGATAALANSIVVADFVADYTVGTVAGEVADFRDGSSYGWQYLWNCPTNRIFGSNIYDGVSGALLDTSSYSNLVWAQTGYWSADSDNERNNGTPANYLNLRLNGGLGDGHPGDGWTEGINKQNRYVITAFTVPEAGYHHISDSLLEKISATADGMDLNVIVNGQLVLSRFCPVDTKIDFDCDLGWLDAGDTVYVATGGYLTNGSDTYDIDYTIYRRPAMIIQSLPTGASIAGGTLTLDPGAYQGLGEGDTAYETFTYTVDDNGELTTAIVTIEIQGVNDTPVPVNDGQTTDEDSAAISGDVLSNDSDPDMGDIQNLTVSEVQGNPTFVGLQTTSDKGGLITLFSGGWYSYDHTNMFNSLAVGESTTDTFVYKIEDAQGAESSEATVTITITGNDDGVVAVTNSYTLEEDETISGNVVTDNTGDGIDINIDTNDRLMISSVNTTGMLGTLTMGELQTVCFRGKVTPTGVPQTVVYDAGETFTSPVVFVSPAGVSDPEPGSVVITNITDSSFVIAFKEQREGGAGSDNDGLIHTNTTELSYMVFESGEYMLADGTRFEVGTSEVTAVHKKDAVSITWDVVTFATPFDAQPIVLNQLQSWNDPLGKLFGTRMNGNPYTAGSVKTNQFEIALEGYEADTLTQPQSETVGWIAIDRDNGTWDGNLFDANYKTGIKVLSGITSKAFSVDFGSAPYLLGTIPTTGGADPATLRSRTITGTTFEFCIHEDQTAETELSHSDENITYLAVGGASTTLTAYNVTGGAGAFTYDPAGAVAPPPSGSIVESFTYTLRDEHGNESTAAVSITVESMRDGTLIILR